MKKLLAFLVLLVGLVLSSIPSFADVAITNEDTLQNAELSAKDGKQLLVDKYTVVGLQITIAGTATVTFETSANDGAPFISTTCVLMSDTGGTSVTIATASGAYQCNIASMKWFRARISSWTSGAVTVFARASTAVGGRGGGSGAITGAVSIDQTTQGVTNGVYLTNLLACEDQPNQICRVNGGPVLLFPIFSGVTTNSTTANTTVYGGGKTPIITETGTGAIGVTVDLYGDADSTTTNGELICTMAISGGTDKAVKSCDQFVKDYAFYHAVISGISGTAATVRLDVIVGVAGSAAGNKYGVYAEDTPETPGGNLASMGSIRRDAATSSAGTSGDHATLNTDASGLLWSRSLDPCSGIAKTFVPISISTATTTQLVAASASNFIYVCNLTLLPTAGAQNIALIEDDTSACASPTAGMAGGITAATGANIAVNGGYVLGTGVATVAKTAATNRYVCLISSAAQQTSGVMSYVLAP